ncbi:hypothetical protein [Kribbella swartbergensis]
MDVVDVACADLGVAAAIEPTSIRRADPGTANELLLTIATLVAARSLADLDQIRSRSLVRLDGGTGADYFFGTRRTGVLLRPADRYGRTLTTAHTLESLMKIQSVVILAVGLALAQAVSA